MQETPVFIIHSLEQALRAARAAEKSRVAVHLFSAKEAAASLGPELFVSIIKATKQQMPMASLEGYLDCGADVGLALSALRRGATRISIDLPKAAQTKILKIAEQQNAQVVAYPEKGMDLARTDHQDQDLLDHIRTHTNK